MASRADIERLVEEYYSGAGRYYSDVNKSGVKYFSMPFPTHVNDIEVDTFVSDSNVSIECLLPTNVPKAKYTTMCEYLMRANDAFRCKFELNFNSGKARVRCEVDFEEIEITTGYIKDTFYMVLFNTLKILYGFVKVVYSNDSAEDCLEESLQAFDDYLESQKSDD